MIPKSTLGRGNRHKCFKIFDEYCSTERFKEKHCYLNLLKICFETLLYVNGFGVKN